MAAIDLLSSELAFKAHVDSVARDYVTEPHLGEFWGSSPLCEAQARP